MKRFLVHTLFISLFNLIGLGLVYHYSDFTTYHTFHWVLFTLWTIVLTSVATLIAEGIEGD